MTSAPFHHILVAAESELLVTRINAAAGLYLSGWILLVRLVGDICRRHAP
jgi:hypothetical protein